MQDEHLHAPGAPPPRLPWRAVTAWGLGLIATLAAAALAAVAGVVLAVVGLGGVVFVAAAGVVLCGATVWRRRMLPLAVFALALALPASWAANAGAPLDRSRGALVVAPRAPEDLRADTYRRGVGPVLIDLRRFSAPAGSTTRIAARADSGKLVVALPHDRCFNLDVRFRTDQLTYPASFAIDTAQAVAGSARNELLSVSGIGLTARASQADSLRAEQATFTNPDGTQPYDLLAFNRWASEAGRYRRKAVGQALAPTLRLELRSSQQMVIRDYPANVGPLSLDQLAFGPNNQIGGMLWPEGLQAPLAPVERSWAGRSVIRTPKNRARWLAWEARMIAWAKAQAKRAAGPCASTDDLRARGFSFLTQPEAVVRSRGTDRLLGSPRYRRSTIAQAPVRGADSMVQVEVNGLGQTRLVGVQPGAGNGADSMATRQLP